MGIACLNDVLTIVSQPARGEADDNPGRNPDGSRHECHGSRELLAVADSLVKKGLQRIGTRWCYDVGAVGEAAILGEEVNECLGLGIGRLRIGSDLCREQCQLGSEGVGQLQRGDQRVRGPPGGCTQLSTGGLDVVRRHAVGQISAGDTDAAHRARGWVPGPACIQGLINAGDKRRGVGHGQVRVVQIGDADVGPGLADVLDPRKVRWSEGVGGGHAYGSLASPPRHSVEFIKTDQAQVSGGGVGGPVAQKLAVRIVDQVAPQGDEGVNADRSVPIAAPGAIPTGADPDRLG